MVADILQVAEEEVGITMTLQKPVAILAQGFLI